MTARIPVTQLSPLAQALFHRPIAQLVIDARTGSPETLRAIAERYLKAAQELEPAGHIEVATILEVYGNKAKRLAWRIEHRLEPQRAATWLREVA